MSKWSVWSELETDDLTHLFLLEVIHEDLPKLCLPILKEELETFRGDCEVLQRRALGICTGSMWPSACHL